MNDSQHSLQRPRTQEDVRGANSGSILDRAARYFASCANPEAAINDFLAAFVEIESERSSPGESVPTAPGLRKDAERSNVAADAVDDDGNETTQSVNRVHRNKRDSAVSGSEELNQSKPSKRQRVRKSRRSTPAPKSKNETDGDASTALIVADTTSNFVTSLRYYCGEEGCSAYRSAESQYHQSHMRTHYRDKHPGLTFDAARLVPTRTRERSGRMSPDRGAVEGRGEEEQTAVHSESSFSPFWSTFGELADFDDDMFGEFLE